MKLVATFYSHFGAVHFAQQCKAAGIAAKLTPVPRNLSSSCGTCVRYELEEICPVRPIPEELEQIAEAVGEGYRVHYRAQNS